MRVRVPMRVLGWTIALALLAVPVVGLLQGWFASASWPIRTLTVSGEYTHVPAAAVRAAVLPYIGKGFFATDLDDVRQAVDALPWVASVSARKRWPDTLVITVHEQHAFAHWNRTRLVDRQGRLFRVPHADGVSGLPRLDGPPGQLDAVVRFYLHVNHALSGVGLHVTGVHLDRRGDWRVQLAGHSQVVIGREHPHRRLRRFVRAYPALAGSHRQRFAYADLRYTNGFAVRWPASAGTDSATAGASPT